MASRSEQLWAGDRLSRRNVLSAAVMAGPMGLLSAACSTGQSATTPKQPRAGKAKPGGTLRRGRAYDPSTFDSSDKLNITAEVLGLTNDGLVSVKAGPGVDYANTVIQPQLAERWETPDAQMFTFHLRRGVRFADVAPLNGRELTAADVKFTIEYLTRTGDLKDKKLSPAPTAALFEGLDSIETPDPVTVVVHFAQPFIPFLNYAATEYTSVLAHEIFDQDGNFSKRAIGTGPWQLDVNASQKGSRWLFRKNQTYFMPGRPYLDEVDWLILPDDATENAAFRTNQTDIIDYQGLSLDTVKQMQKSVPGVIVDEYLSDECSHIYINVTKPPLNDVRIRRAIGLCIDREEFIKVLGKGQWTPSGSSAGLFNQEEARQLLKVDPASAKQLVIAAGYGNGVDIEFIYPGLKYGQQLITKLQLLQSQTSKAGVNLVLKSLDAATESGRRRTGEFQLAVTPTELDIAGDLDGPLYVVYHPKSVGNYGRVNDPVLTPMLEAQRQEVDPSKRKEIARDAVRRINDMTWGLALFYPTAYNLSQPYVQGYAPHLGHLSDPLTDAWLNK